MSSDRLEAHIRDAVEADLQAILDIYNALIPTTTVAWSETLQTLSQRRAWFRALRENGFPVIIAEQAGEVIGFAAYGSFRGAGLWPGYRFTVEHLLYVRDGIRQGGVGRALMERLIELARAAGIHVMVGAIDADNEASLRFHQRLDFVEVARMPEIGHKFGAWRDLVFVQRILR